MKVEEKWKKVVGYEFLYEVSNYGNVKSLNYNKTPGKNEIIKKCKNNKGYEFVTLWKYGDKKRFLVHRLVAMAFIPIEEGREFVNHIDGIKTNNFVDNLEWCTCKENVHHAIKTGLTKFKKKEKHPMYGKKSILNKKSKKVLCINTNEIFNGVREASKITGIDHGDISRCCNGKVKSAGKHKETKEKLIWRFL